MRNKSLFDLWASHGYYVIPAHFYEPIPDASDVERALSARSQLPGVDLAPERQLALLGELEEWRAEYDSLPRSPEESEDGFYLHNTFFGAVDAEVYYALVRRFKPSRIFEIGSGFSTFVAARACAANERETGHACTLLALEPYPSALLQECPPEQLTRLERVRLQEVPLDTFAQLERDDILFIDSSHVAATGSDVCVALLEVVPRLAPGVLVHVHDVFLPAEYPSKWLREDHYFWTEQYLLHAFLAFNDAFETLWAGQFIHLEFSDVLQATFTSYDPPTTSPGSFWFRRRQ